MSGHHAHHGAEKQSAALKSMFASGGLTLLKLFAAFWTGSLGVLSEAIHSLLDFAATVITLIAVRLSDEPADAEHHYGHTKYESIAALTETVLLFATCIWIVYEAVLRLVTGENNVDAHPAAILIMIISITVDFFRARHLKQTAEKTRSQALEADALHFASDMWSSAVVIVGLALVWLGLQMADAIAAIVVSGFVAHAGWELSKSTLASLLDAAPIGVAHRRCRGDRAPAHSPGRQRALCRARYRGEPHPLLRRYGGDQARGGGGRARRDARSRSVGHRPSARSRFRDDP
jgi:cation diffusion facilitator family transporter